MVSLYLSLHLNIKILSSFVALRSIIKKLEIVFSFAFTKTNIELIYGIKLIESAYFTIAFIDSINILYYINLN